jgi:hypothetical protein
MSVTPNYGFELLEPSQAQPEVPLNFDWNLLDTLLKELGGSIDIKQVGDSPAGNATGVTTIHIAGATVEQLSNGGALITIDSSSGGGGGGSVAVTDGTTKVSDATLIEFDGAVVTSSGSPGAAHVAIISGTKTYFGNGAPSSLHNNGDLYFDVSSSPIQAYVQVDEAVSPSIENHGTGTSAASTTVVAALTTVAANLAVAVVGIEHPTTFKTVTGIAASGLTWTKYNNSETTNGAFVNCEIWTAPLSAGFSGNITATMDATPDSACIIVFGIEGADLTDIFNTGTNLPALIGYDGGTGTIADATGIATNKPNTLVLYGMCNNHPNIGAPPSGFSNLATETTGAGAALWCYLRVDYDIPGAELSGFTVSSGLNGSGAAPTFFVAAVNGGTGSDWRQFI